ncbi:uncharacterized protein E0L32_003408 [Thyridium curvatum]|uniref:Fe2OG dioxygenase domain-containing protein n=1 Tax=Thyridium curvatum TaxID=1093900 RepID=A0A507BC79_9PEZI|nr:uncharacterized protein E0L32_003408 [Thyridium curvatum]TPX16846.1 hypothetical protein E0L32_003408 [Thyridium curvatum]
MDTSPIEQPPSKRRRFRIQSEFGRARQWRSRKSRPCDTCRRRRFCRGKGLECKATSDPGPPKKAAQEDDSSPTESSPLEAEPDVDIGIEVAIHAPPPLTAELPVLSNLSPVRPVVELTAATLSPPWTINNDESLETPPAIASPDNAIAALPANSGRNHRRRTTVHTLEDGPNLTAHSMGLSGEQDPELLSSFRSVVMNEVNRVDADIIQLCAGDIVTNQPPVHFTILHDEFAPLDIIAKDAASDRMEATVDGHGDNLVRLYFKHVHPVYPVLSKTRFLRAYAEDKTKIPASLRGAVYGLAANFWKHDPSMTNTLGFNQHELFEDALACLQRELHGPDLWTMQACLLLMHENPAANATIESPRVWTLAAQAVACAQMIGLHRDPMVWNIAPYEKSMRRKLWWAAFAVDVWSSICHGNPPHIHTDSFTTSLLTMEDIAFDEEVPPELSYLVHEEGTRPDISTSARFYEYTTLSLMLHRLLIDFYSDVKYQDTMQDPVAREGALLGFKTKLHNWESLLPRCVTLEMTTLNSPHLNNAPLHLSFYTGVALLYRALMSPVTKAAKRDPNSSLRRHFNEAIRAFAPFTMFMGDITPECLHAFWGNQARSQLILCGNFLIYLFLLAPDPEQVQATFQLLERFHDSLQRLSAAADEVSIHLLRPVALRIDSFFSQAAQIMRTGAAAPISPIPSPHYEFHPIGRSVNQSQCVPSNIFFPAFGDDAIDPMNSPSVTGLKYKPLSYAPELQYWESNTRSSLGIQKITRSAKMGSDSIAEQDLAIPVIDFAPMRSGNPEDAAAVGRKVYEAFRDVGFAYIKNHGIPQETVDEAFQWSAKFFALPQAVKDKAPHPPYGWWHRGYSGVGREKVVQMVFDEQSIGELRKVPDFKESFELGRETDEKTKNIWLPEEDLPGFRAFFNKFYETGYQLELQLLRAIAIGMGLDEKFFWEYHTKGDNQVRLLHYPPVEEELLRGGKMERIAAHTDFGTMTMLFQDQVGGLEVEDIHEKGKFNPAPYVPGAIVVNIGDFLQRWSNDELKSTLHRVRAPPLTDDQGGVGKGKITRARYSIPYFVTADREKTIDCLPGCWGPDRPKKYEPINSHEYISMRLNATY